MPRDEHVSGMNLPKYLRNGVASNVESIPPICSLSGLGDQTLSDTPLLRSGDGTHGVIESVAREVAALLLGVPLLYHTSLSDPANIREFSA